MFKKRKELEGLLRARNKALLNAEEEVKKWKETADCLRENLIKSTNENRRAKELIGEILEAVKHNTYNNEKIVLRKIKELINDSELQ